MQAKMTDLPVLVALNKASQLSNHLYFLAVLPLIRASQASLTQCVIPHSKPKCSGYNTAKNS